MNDIVLKLITGSNKYSERIIKFSSTLSEENLHFIDILKSLGITKLNMSTVGNSIATGYSATDIIRPLLLRNCTLNGMLVSNGIDADFYNFSRAQDNSEERLLEYIYDNIKQSEINRRNHVDFKGGPTGMLDRSGITDEEIDKYFPLNLKKDIGLHDLILERSDDLANILIYSGCTGSFLDNLTRKGEHLNLLYGFKRDILGLESFLKLLYIESPYTQVYVVGISNILNINLVHLINSKIKAMCEKYSNVTYVESAPAHMFYDKNGRLAVDIHHNQAEYLNLNNNIFRTINDTYIQNIFNIELDMFLSGLSDEHQFNTPELRNDTKPIEEYIETLLSKYKPLLERQNKDIKEVLNNFIKYYRERYPYDYFYISKEGTIDILENQR